MDGVYHVVCHECPFEGLYHSLQTALGEREEHEQEHSHRVSYLELSRPDPVTEA